MSKIKYTNGIFMALISEGFISMVKRSAMLDCAMWNPQDDDGKYLINALLDFTLNIKGFHAIGIGAVNIRFNIEFFDCTLNETKDGFVWNGNGYSIWGGNNSENFIFTDINGEVLEVDGVNGLYQTHFKDINDEAISVDLIEALKLSMSRGETEELLRNSLRHYNKMYKDCKI